MAINCYALDLAAYPLFMDGTHSDKDGKTMAVYEELLTSQLLALAIALRTKFYQGADPQETVNYVLPAGLLYKFKNDDEENTIFSIKDVCDKIIHADTIYRDLEKGDPKPVTILSGKHGKIKWELGSVDIHFNQRYIAATNTKDKYDDANLS
jgi:hypothetical protein